MRPRLFSPARIVLLSALSASLALSAALALSRDGAFARDPAPLRPERAAEEFMSAFRARDYARAASWATGHLLREMQKRAKSQKSSDGKDGSDDGRSWLLQESHLLREDKLRFHGVLVRPDQDESSGWPVEVTVVRRDARYLVEDLHWPKGPPR